MTYRDLVRFARAEILNGKTPAGRELARREPLRRIRRILDAGGRVYNKGADHEQNRENDPSHRGGTGGAAGPADYAGGAAGGAGEGAGAGVGTIPDRAGYLTGWRAWRLDTTAGGLLRSINNKDPWPRGVIMRATCYQGEEHRPPDPDCTCGLYAYKARESLPPEVWLDTELVVGEVALWGRVVEARDGYRAECAYPLRLQVSEAARIRVLQGLQAYGVPVEVQPFTTPLLAPGPYGPATPGAGGVTGPTRAVPAPTPALYLAQQSWWVQEKDPLPNTQYTWQLPLGYLYRTIELGPEAGDRIRRVWLIANRALIVVEADLDVLDRTGSGGFIVYNGLRDGSAIDSNMMSRLELRVETEPAFPTGPAPLRVGFLHHLIRRR